MIVDTNILLYISHKKFSQHTQAYNWFEETINRKIRIGIPYVSLMGFVRISLSQTRIRDAMTHQEVLGTAQQFINFPSVWIPEPAKGYFQIASDLILEHNLTKPNDITDAYLAALAIQNSVPLVTHDSGFRRFRELRIIDPIED